MFNSDVDPTRNRPVAVADAQVAVAGDQVAVADAQVAVAEAQMAVAVGLANAEGLRTVRSLNWGTSAVAAIAPEQRLAAAEPAAPADKGSPCLPSSQLAWALRPSPLSAAGRKGKAVAGM